MRTQNSLYMKHFIITPFCLCLLASAPLEALVLLTENFNTGIPSTWTISNPTCFNSSGDTTVWQGTTSGWRGQGLSGFSIDSTEFAIVDSDFPGVFCACDEYLTSPVFDASNNSMLYLNYDQYFRYYSAGFAETGEVQVFDGLTWITVSTFTATSGAWMAPNQQSVNLTPYMNANMQVRFHYNANWDWFWAIDNVVISDTLTSGTNAITDQNNFEIFPVPTTGIIQIYSHQEHHDVAVSVTNVFGQEVYSSVYPTLSNVTVDLSTMADGVYFVKVITAHSQETTKIVKQ